MSPVPESISQQVQETLDRANQAVVQAATRPPRRIASSGVDPGPAAVAPPEPMAAASVAPEGATPEPSPDAAPAILSAPATVAVPAKVGLTPQSQVKPKAAQNGSGSHESNSTPFRGRPPEHQAQMRRMNALTNAVAVVPSLVEKPTTIRAVLRLAAHFERWVASGVVPDA